MPFDNADQNEVLTREWELTSDDNTLKLAKRIVYAYNKIGLLESRWVDEANNASDINIVNDIIERVPNMTTEQRLDFCREFVGDAEDFNGATPAILADAYRALAMRRRDDIEQEIFDRLGQHIDGMSADFSNTGGMVVNSSDWPIVDTNNIADVYEGFANMLNARRDELGRNPGDAQADEKINEIDKNLNYIENVVRGYDEGWGIDNLQPEDASKLEQSWDDSMLATSRARVTDENQRIASNVKFLDAKDRVIPQFVDADGNLHEDWEPGMRIDKKGRLGVVWDLACHDVAKKNVAKFDQEIDETEIEAQVNEEFLNKLYEIGVADKIVQGAIKDPDAFSRPESREQLIAELANVSGLISDTGFNAAIDAQTNATAGWASRVKAKLGNASQKTRGFFAKVFRPLERIDRLANVRMTRNAVDKHAKRRELFVRILKGLASSFIASALITGIATAAAAAAGMSVAAGLAMVGIITAIGMGVVQVMRWRKAQQDAGLPTDIHAFLADKRLLLSLGTSAIAVAAMCFGAAGLTTAAQVLGYGALAIGGGKNTVESFRDARESGMSMAESLAWGLAQAGAVIAGGIAGRFAANTAIDAFNRAHPTNKIFQNETQHTEQRMVEDVREITETRTEYTQEALDNAERIAKMWYRDNPEILQQRVDAINAYNAEYGTNINPYRALLVNGDAGGQTFDNMLLHVNNSHVDSDINDVHSGGTHKVFGAGWRVATGVSNGTINSAAHLFNADGTINPDGMNAVSYLDGYVNADNTVGYVPGRSFHNDAFLHQNDIVRGGEASPNGRAYSTYTTGESAFHDVEYNRTETYQRPEDYVVTDYTRAHGDGMSMFGNYNPRARKNTLRDRVGAFADRIRHQLDKTPEPVPEPELQKQLPAGPTKDAKLLGPGQLKPKQLPVGSDVQPKILNTGKEQGVLPAGTERQPKLLNAGNYQKRLPEGRVEPVDLQYAIEYQDAKDYNDLTANIVKAYKKKHPDYTKIKRLEQAQTELWNKLGRPDMLTFDRARRDAYQRREMVSTIEELSDLLTNAPKPGIGSKREIQEWEARCEKLRQKISALGTLQDLANAIDELNVSLDRFVQNGTVPKEKLIEFTKKRDLAIAYLVDNDGAELLNSTNLYFPTPAKSKSRIVKEERNARLDAEKAARDAERAAQDAEAFTPVLDDVISDVQEPELEIPESWTKKRFDFEYPDLNIDVENPYRANREQMDLSNHTMPRIDVKKMSQTRPSKKTDERQENIVDEPIINEPVIEEPTINIEPVTENKLQPREPRIEDYKNPFAFEHENLSEGFENPYRTNREQMDLSNHTMPRIDVEKMSQIRPSKKIDERQENIVDEPIIKELGTDEPKTNIEPVTENKPQPRIEDYKNPFAFEHENLSAGFENPYRKNREQMDLLNNATARLLKIPFTMKLGEVPVNLVGLGADKSPVVLIDDVPILVVDIKGLRIPFYQDQSGWQPLYHISKSSKIYANNDKIINSKTIIPDNVARIVYGLNRFVGVVDKNKIPYGSISEVFNLVGHTPEGSEVVWGSYPDDFMLVGPYDIDKFLNKVQSEAEPKKQFGTRFRESISRIGTLLKGKSGEY